MSPLTDAIVINGAVLFATLEADLGPHRKIGLVRILRTPLVVAAVIPLFLDRPVTHGNGLLVEIAGIAAGLLCGLVVTTLMRVYRSPKTGKPVSAAACPTRWSGSSSWAPARRSPSAPPTRSHAARPWPPRIRSPARPSPTG